MNLLQLALMVEKAHGIVHLFSRKKRRRLPPPWGGSLSQQQAGSLAGQGHRRGRWDPARLVPVGRLRSLLPGKNWWRLVFQAVPHGLTCYLGRTVGTRKVADTSMWGCSSRPSRSVASPLVSSIGSRTRAKQKLPRYHTRCNKKAVQVFKLGGA